MIPEQRIDSAMNTLARISIEKKLLCLCATPVKSRKLVEQIRQIISNGIQWDKLYQLATEQEVLPLVYQSIAPFCPEIVAPKNLSALQAQLHANARHNLMLTAEFIRLLRIFESRNVPALIYKGPALAMQAYGALTSRQFCDLDLLVQKSDLDKIIGILNTEGYISEESGLNFFQDKWYRLNNCEYHFLKKPENIYLEIHWRFFENHIRFPLSLKDVWQCAQHITINEQQVRSLSPEHTLLILCTHGGGKHHWSTLKMIADIAALIHRQTNLNWQMIQENVDELGIRRLFHTGLLLAKNLLDAPIPESARRFAAQDSHAVQLCQKICANLFDSPQKKLEAPATGIDRSLFYIQSRENIPDKLPHLWYFVRDIFTPTDKETQLIALPPALSILHRFIRPVRLIAKYGKYLLNSLRQTGRTIK